MDSTRDKTYVSAADAYIHRLTEWIKANPDADPAWFGQYTAVGELPPDTAVAANNDTVAAWEQAYPAAHRVYWIVRAALEERDGQRKTAVHHRAAILAIHDSFPGKADRARLGLPATQRQLAVLLGVATRTLRKYRKTYTAVFAATRGTLRDSVLGAYYGRVYEALAESAMIHGREGAADRRLFTQVAGDLTEKHDLTSAGEKMEPAATATAELIDLLAQAKAELAAWEPEDTA